MIREFDEMARVEDEVKKTRQKLGGFMWMQKKFTGPLPPEGPKGTQGWVQGPTEGL